MSLVSIRGPARLRGLVTVGVVFWAAASCVTDPVAKPDESSRPAASQPSVSGNGRLSETEACEALLGAIVAREAALDCEERPVDLSCPEFLRASNPQCATYAQNTVDECVEEIRDYDRCEDFSASRCIATSFDEGGCPVSDASVPMSDGGIGAVDGG